MTRVLVSAASTKGCDRTRPVADTEGSDSLVGSLTMCLAFGQILQSMGFIRNFSPAPLPFLAIQHRSRYDGDSVIVGPARMSSNLKQWNPEEKTQGVSDLLLKLDTFSTQLIEERPSRGSRDFPREE